jgi:hypothetical protein
VEPIENRMAEPDAVSRIRMGEVLRYPKPASSISSEVDGRRNFYAVTEYSSGKRLMLEMGINQPKALSAPEGERVPIIAISESAHKVGRQETPWQDIFDVDNGHIRFFGDNKNPGDDPASRSGNRRLLAAWDAHHGATKEERKAAVPVAFFRRPLGKGFVAFEGVGLIRGCELVTQYGDDGYFSNFAWDFLVLDLAPENETFDWAWINARRDPGTSLYDTLKLAPEAWRTWVSDGETAIPRVRRYVAKRSLVSPQARKPKAGSRLAGILAEVRKLYYHREAEFEGIAAWVAERLLDSTGTYRAHGVTRATGDRGFDFIGRLDLGEGFGAIKLVVLGQAKCEKIESPTNARDIARTVARLRRGWIGVYVTTGYFTTSTQTEVIQDRYPLLLVDGLLLATELDRELRRKGDPALKDLLAEIEARYGRLTELSDPDQVLFL